MDVLASRRLQLLANDGVRCTKLCSRWNNTHALFFFCTSSHDWLARNNQSALRNAIFCLTFCSYLRLQGLVKPAEELSWKTWLCIVSARWWVKRLTIMQLWCYCFSLVRKWFWKWVSKTGVKEVQSWDKTPRLCLLVVTLVVYPLRFQCEWC